ncbi:hypothetical protein FNV43_RR08158 [Rhamnella rubrinervis]|uniref:Transposase (putative) gypsy type domain-containing protein n=1 Tax=Rhamnella rubrinervis TaxID=2594499 RepID=A0A8K0MN05_9ROSA|nr:hypothetical protein FNV43_RR08158 [Rhamnella rubrinervis]
MDCALAPLPGALLLKALLSLALLHAVLAGAGRWALVAAARWARPASLPPAASRLGCASAGAAKAAGSLALGKALLCWRWRAAAAGAGAGKGCFSLALGKAALGGLLAAGWRLLLLGAGQGLLLGAGASCQLLGAPQGLPCAWQGCWLRWMRPAAPHGRWAAGAGPPSCHWPAAPPWVPHRRARAARPPLGQPDSRFKCFILIVKMFESVSALDNTSDGEPSQDANSEDGSAQNIMEDTQGIEGFAITDIRSSIKTTDRLRRLLLPFGIDPNVTFRVPDRDDDPSRPKAGEAVFHIAFFEYGLRLPLLPVFREILHRWGLAPGQLTPNSWRSLVCCYILWKELGMTLTAKEFMYMYHLKKDPKRGRFRSSGWYYASSRKGKRHCGDHNSNKAEGWKSNLRFKEVSSGLFSRIEFAKNQPAADRSYKKLLEKVSVYFSRGALFGEGNSTRPTMTMEGMKKKLNEMRKNGVGEKRGNDGSEGSQSKKSKRRFLIQSPTRLQGSSSPALPSAYLLQMLQTTRGSSSSSRSALPKLSYFAKCSTKILSPRLNEMETISSMQASLLATLG